MIKMKKYACMCLMLSLTLSFPAAAEEIIEPNPLGVSMQNNASEQTNSTIQGGSTVMNNNSTVNTGTPGPGGTVEGNILESIETVTTNNVPAEPVVQAQGASLYNVTTGQFVFTKNADQTYYPASITKIMTALLVLEKCNLDDTVTFSETAVSNMEAGSVSLGITAGDKLTVRECLYALLLKSANEVANGLAEHTAGSISAFCTMMNERAKAIGCTNTNFENPNGLNNTNHYTTPHDMALIAAEAFKNENLCKIASTLSYKIPATKLAAERTVSMGHKMLYPSDARYYEGIVGGKTGYTSKAGNTLVTCAERDGVRLVAVILKSSQTHYQDTKALLDYGFNNADALGLKTGVPLAQKGQALWGQDSTGWYLLKPDNTRAKSQMIKVDGYTYLFDESGYMKTGWQQLEKGWYYFKPNGVMAKSYWVKTDEKYFYVGEDGVLLTNTTTPDGYQVDSQGIWIQ